AHCQYGDFYPLTPYSRDEREWIGWQFHLPETDEGMVQVFMRPESPFETALFKLQGLDDDGEYTIKDYNTGLSLQVKGAELGSAGLTVKRRQKLDSALYYYRRILY
ncbi:MAG TPA: hypothetical protein DD640_00380, partial [Clostridiales bacterium]|nr:hypothetical protein [Clostridiales bacterium]